MPKDATSPFTPGQPVDRDFFIGRVHEIERLEKKVVSSIEASRPEVVFLSGERGIGKSSLASFVRYLVEQNHQALGIHTLLGGAHSMEDLARTVFERLLKKSYKSSWWDKVKTLFENRIQDIGLFGVNVTFKASQDDLTQLVRGFIPALQKLMEQLEESHKGLFLVFDDINGLASSPDFANWLKSLVDEISVNRIKLPLCILLVGLEERRQSLINLQPSLTRVLDLIEIKAWSHSETKKFFERSFDQVGIRVSEKAMDILSRYSGGLPMLAHEIGDAAFNADTGNQIDDSDALAAVITAAEIVGRKHLQPQVFNAISSTLYRNILRRLAQLSFETGFEAGFSRAEVLSQLPDNEKNVFDNFIQRMTDLGVISADLEQGRGFYRFKNLLHSVYFYMEAQRAN